jgi:hypothetical protein
MVVVGGATVVGGAVGGIVGDVVGRGVVGATVGATVGSVVGSTRGATVVGALGVVGRGDGTTGLGLTDGGTLVPGKLVGTIASAPPAAIVVAVAGSEPAPAAGGATLDAIGGTDVDMVDSSVGSSALDTAGAALALTAGICRLIAAVSCAGPPPELTATAATAIEAAAAIDPTAAPT